MARKEFSKAVKIARLKHCGDHRGMPRCEGVLEDGTPDVRRCFTAIKTGNHHFDHHNPDGLSGEPTFENCRVLCLLCHAAKTKVDVPAIAKAKRREAGRFGVRTARGKKLQGPGFLKSPRKRPPKTSLKPKNLYPTILGGRHDNS